MRAERLPTPLMSDVEQALAWHDGDVEATIKTLLRDCDHLREQLVLARGCISKGLTRGWLPQLDVKDV